MLRSIGAERDPERDLGAAIPAWRQTERVYACVKCMHAIRSFRLSRASAARNLASLLLNGGFYEHAAHFPLSRRPAVRGRAVRARIAADGGLAGAGCDRV